MKHKYLIKSLFFLCFGFLLFSSCQENTEKNTAKNEEQLIKIPSNDLDRDLEAEEEENEQDAEHKKGIEIIAQYLEDIRKPIGAKNDTYEDGYLMTEYAKAKKTNRVNGRSTNEAIWKERGPSNVPGRTRSIIVSPTDSTKWYAGSVGGGLWVTKNSGNTWENLTDYKIPNLATSTVAIGTSEPETIYLGTGEPFGNLDGISGTGIVKSTDDGQSWAYLDSTKGFGDIGRLALNPDDVDNLIVASSRGIYVTADGGSSWKKTFGTESFKDEDSIDATNVQDLNAVPGDFNTLYAGVNNLGIIKSTDGGLSWKVVFDRDDYNPNNSRFELDISPVNPDKVILGVFTYNGNATTAINTDFYVTDNAGADFKLLGVKKNDSVPLENKNLLSGQGWYDNIITAHPYDENIFYAGGVYVSKVAIEKEDDSLFFTSQSIAAGYRNDQINKNVHVDQHGLTWIKGENDTFRLISSNDGGVYSTNFKSDPGTEEGDWTDPAIGYNSTQYYGATKANGSDNYIAGAQDNGTHISNVAAGADANTAYQSIIGGDGFEVIWHYDSINKFIGGSQYNSFIRFTSQGTFYAYHGDQGSATSPFYSKISNANNNPETVFSPSINGVWRSTNFAESWELTPLPEFYYAGANSSALDVAVSTANPDVVWAAHAMIESGGLVPLVSQDNGNSFQPVQPFQDNRAGKNHSYYISGLETSYTDKNTAYLLFSGQDAAKVIRTTDLGETWEDISGFSKGRDDGFPDVATHCLVEMPFDKDVLWVGTDIGIFQTIDGGKSWAMLKGLPAVSVYELKIVNDQVVIATHGRGVWTATLDELKGYEPPAYYSPPSIVEAYQESIENTNAVVRYDVKNEDVETVNFFVDGEAVDSISEGFEEAGTESQFTLENLEEGLHIISVQVVSSEGKESILAKAEIAIVDYEAPEEFVSLDVFKPEDVFTFSNEFVIDSVTDVSQNVLVNKDIPYLDNSEYRTILKRPITITATSAQFTYEDVAIVEPGNDQDLFDYVTVEASKDLRNWVSLDTYDARLYDEWAVAYATRLQGEPSTINDDLFKEETYSLLLEDKEGNPIFNIGDDVVIRFRLVSDPAENNFGWAIRSINKQFLSTEDAQTVDAAVSLYPTVSNGQVTIASKTDLGESTVQVFNISGKKVYDKKVDLSFQEQQLALDGMSSGVYLVKIDSAKKDIVRRIVIR